MAADWSDERVAELKRRFQAGESASVIAAGMGGFDDCVDKGRSAVIGKIFRLKLKRDVAAMTSCVTKRGIQAPAAVAARSGPNRVAANSIPRVPPRPQPPLASKPEAPQTRMQIVCETIAIEPPPPTPTQHLSGQGVYFAQLSDLTCKWPIGDPQAPDFHFCGGKPVAGLPYCAHHCRVAYQPAGDRRRTASAAMR